MRMVSSANKPGKNRNFFESLKHAFQGVKKAFANERNLRFQLASGIAAIVLGGILRLSYGEWLVLVLMIFAVLVTEMINTVVEALVDWQSEGEFDERARAVKDLAAGASLICASGAFVIGLLIFGRHLLALIF